MDCQNEHHNEICITLETQDGEVIQDLALARAKDGCNDVAEVLVWADKEDEDYTDKFEIGQYNGDDLPDLPDEAIIELSELDCDINDEEEIREAVVDFLTDVFGFCINSCAISLKDEGLAKVTKIDWDTKE